MVSEPLWVTVDVGNSRAKACLYFTDRGEEPRPLGPHSRATWAGVPEPHELREWLAPHRPVAAAVSCVRGARAYADWADVLSSEINGPVWTPPPTGLWLDVDSPDTVGHDRLFAGLGALQRTKGPTLVVDAGTALTVDALLYREDERGSLPARASGNPPPGSRGTFLGGAIAPGPKLLIQALAQGGAQLPEIQGANEAPAWGRSTHEALRAGVTVGFQGAARQLVERLRAETGWSQAPLVLTGGAAFALEEVLQPDLRLHDLVHEGLWWALAACVEQGSS